MVDAIIRWCLKHAFLVVLGVGAIAAGGYCALTRTPVDAIPDIGEKQVIVFADWPGRSPQEVEDQITYPLTVNLQGLDRQEVERGVCGC
jgi:Cu(I)/Ag(I) efflux system membrane protein CusA/SilA